MLTRLRCFSRKRRAAGPVVPSDLGDCSVCLEEGAATSAAVPCGHQAFCEWCAEKVRTCPICRADVHSVVRVYAVTTNSELSHAKRRLVAMEEEVRVSSERINASEMLRSSAEAEAARLAERLKRQEELTRQAQLARQRAVEDERAAVAQIRALELLKLKAEGEALEARIQFRKADQTRAERIRLEGQRQRAQRYARKSGDNVKENKGARQLTEQRVRSSEDACGRVEREVEDEQVGAIVASSSKDDGRLPVVVVIDGN